MSAYVKKIAVIKQVKSGFSADGGAISGLVKAETYAGFLKVEVSLINFAPLTEGRYVMGITDGLNTITFDALNYEGEAEFNLSCGFAFLVCFCHTSVAPVASASCGQMACALPDLKEEMTRRENVRPKPAGVAYDDEAISEVNYYERHADEGGAAVYAAETKKETGRSSRKNASDIGAVQGEEAVTGQAPFEGDDAPCDGDGDNSSRKSEISDVVSVPVGMEDVRVERLHDAEDLPVSGEDLRGGLSGGDFYTRMKDDVEKIFKTYPKDEGLERTIEGSRFARISYGEGKFYVFGVLTVEGKPRYLCYGVPSTNPHTPPRSLKGCSSYVPVDEGRGYWLTYQDAATGVSIKIGVE